MFYSQSASVPISMKKVELRVDLYQHGESLPTLEVAIPVSCSNADELQDLCVSQQLKLVSPPEQVHAMLFSVARAIKAAGDEDDAQLEKWRDLLRSVPMKFKFMGKEALYWASLNFREAMDTSAVAVRRTLLQRIFEIVAFQEDRQISGAHAVAEQYAQNMRYGPRSEQVTKGFVDSAITIEDRMLSIPECRKILCEADDLDDSVFNQITKLQMVVSRARTPEMISWCVRHLWDMQQNNQFRAGFPSLRHMVGQAAGLFFRTVKII